MNSYVQRILMCSLMIFSASCQSRQQDQNIHQTAFNLFGRFSGNWKLNDGETYEHWTKSDGQFSGRVYRVIENDTVLSETFSLVSDGNTIVYRVVVFDQNDAKPVDFRMREVSDDRVVFVNPDHDFPETITYTIDESGLLEAEVSGTINGLVKKINFRYIRE